MTSLFNLFVQLPDLVILVVGAAATAGLALAIALLTRRFWFAPRADRLETHTKLADLVHSGLLAFAVFLLALVLSDVRANLGRADDATLREASVLTRLDRELSLIGDSARDARVRLRAYADAIVSDEWLTLGRAEPELSGKAEGLLRALNRDVHALAANNPAVASQLRALFDRAEDLRQGRLENATKSIASIFWWMIGAFVLGAMAMNGRNPVDANSATLILLHMAPIGLVMSLIIVMDEPFRGETSISSAPIAKALTSGPAP